MKRGKKELSYTDSLHRSGKIFSTIALILILAVPVVYCIAAGVLPDWGAVGSASAFILGYVAICLIEVISYAPILGVGGQYLAFITGNISNLKLPCSINAQNIAKTKQGSEEQEIISTISIAVSSIVTTVIVALGLIPLAFFGDTIVNALSPVTPYVIPAIFGGLGVVLLAKFFKLAILPLALMILTCVVAFLLGYDPGQSTMLTVGMAVSLICGFITYKLSKNKVKPPKDSTPEDI